MKKKHHLPQNGVNQILDLVVNLSSFSTRSCYDFLLAGNLFQGLTNHMLKSTSLKHLLGGQGEIQSRIESCNCHR